MRRFTLAAVRMIEVKEDFPRLTPGRVPSGITRAAYEIDLDKAVGDNFDAVDALKKLGAI